MKKLFIILLLFSLAGVASAQDITIRIVPYTEQFVPPQPPPKPNFRTPIRDGLWYGGVYFNQWLWYNRYWRHQRLERLLGPQK